MTDISAILDQAVLAELRASVGGDDAFVHELAGAYLAEGTTHLDAMADALASGDLRRNRPSGTHAQVEQCRAGRAPPR